MTSANPESFNWIRWVVSIVIPVLSGFVGVLIGAWLAGRQQREQLKLSFIEKQIKNFYSPLLGIRNEIQMLSELRQKISISADANWRKLCEEAQKRGDPEATRKLTEKRKEKFDRLINYDNRQLTESLLPLYHRMINIFRDNYYLAESRTRDYFRSLLEFVDIWDRWLDKSIPREVLKDLEHSEKTLKLLYDDLQKNHDELRAKLSKGKV